MTTTIVPALGAGVLNTQQGVGTSPGYAALDDRRSVSGSLQEGVYGTSTLVTAGGAANTGQADFMVTQRAAGANMSVDVNMPAGGFAYVQGDTVNGQGLYCVPVHSANINEAIAAADPTNPRVDQVILEVQDNALDASGGNLARTRVLTGTPTGGASLTNRTGALALPANALLLADVLVGNAVASLANAVMRDRRKWARGAYVRLVKTNANPSNATTTLAAIDTATLQARVECSGVPVRLRLQSYGSNATATDGIMVVPWMDGATFDSITAGWVVTSATTSANGPQGFDYPTIPSAGSHTFTPAFAASIGGTATLVGSAASPIVFTIEEVVKQNTGNNTVTSG